jgi:hypothetical protein
MNGPLVLALVIAIATLWVGSMMGKSIRTSL